MRVTVKDLSNYLGVSRKTATKNYRMYLDILETKRTYLTVFDIAKIDQIPLIIVCNEMGIACSDKLQQMYNKA
ncbi:MAG: hypothetical protein RIM68_12330 [Arenibacter sp.]